MGRSKSRRERDRKLETTAKAIVVAALKKEKDNGKSTTGGRAGRSDA
jgi:hypothetical protein